MKRIQKATQKKTIILVAAATSAVIALGVFLVIANNNNMFTSDQNKNQSTTTEEQTPIKTPESIQSDKTTSPPNTDHITTPTYDESTGKQVARVVVSVSTEENTLYIRGGLNMLVTDGLCYAELRGPHGEVINKETSLLPSASTTDCKTISIPNSELTKGTWTVTLNYSSTNVEGRSSVASFVIQ